jgi:hypothetical protein
LLIYDQIDAAERDSCALVSRLLALCRGN